MFGLLKVMLRDSRLEVCDIALLHRDHAFTLRDNRFRVCDEAFVVCDDALTACDSHFRGCDDCLAVPKSCRAQGNRQMRAVNASRVR